MFEICLCQRSDLELYISVAKCLSEMTDDGANQLSQITQVTIPIYTFSLLRQKFPLKSCLQYPFGLI